MYVCICNAVTEEDILDAVDAGASCVRSVCKATRAASNCGTCFQRVQGVAKNALACTRNGLSEQAAILASA